ncbi:uncharacterized protein UV8b_01645 [Ustilaginoidea virens]|uniref:Copper acquisition factor BIM1-like domain-containing protein n=1 Tax=Ustilaginoidea virens TaxID=1159556 RepID=A0A063BRD4_USTVR|nr:uncharacterized protein UV8b_01645 [Ustilaginoidea virens]QUC17404.1 hypothetical protein UV8b_01645 [Ustilaginoidea virens]GAO13715.1 hypothetical protein UVI_02018140 [Ustilaginoidea virens]
MLSALVVALALAVHSVSAHFGLIHPPWRFDTLSKAGEAKYSQWTYPCAGVAYKSGNVTDWPVGGGALKLDLHHAWTYVFVNLGLGDNATNFNVSLTPEFWNVTGKGTLCVDKLPVPVAVEDGTPASLQVVTVGESGSALYNCADIRLVKDAKGPANCTSSSGVKVSSVRQQQQQQGGGGNSSGNGTTGSDKGSGGGVVVSGANIWALVTAAGLAYGFALVI